MFVQKLVSVHVCVCVHVRVCVVINVSHCKAHFTKTQAQFTLKALACSLNEKLRVPKFPWKRNFILRHS